MDTVPTGTVSPECWRIPVDLLCRITGPLDVIGVLTSGSSQGRVCRSSMYNKDTHDSQSTTTLISTRIYWAILNIVVEIWGDVNAYI